MNVFVRWFAAMVFALQAQLSFSATQNSSEMLDPLAQDYVKLVLALGVHDADAVDAYYGPAQWRTEAEQQKLPLEEIRSRSGALRERVRALDLADAEEIVRLRQSYLDHQLGAIVTRVDLLRGVAMRFDEESRRTYDAVAPHFDDEHFAAILRELDEAIPGVGSLAERVELFRKRFQIPAERVAAVFDAAIAEARKRTQQHIALPTGESFTVEYVTDKPWAAYNWYQGGYHSVIQVNVSQPITIDRAIDLACHEGYPGHHVYNALLEEKLLRERGWVEFSVYPLFSPQSLIAEGTANYGIEVAFPGDEKLAFERDVLFPLAGFDPASADEYARVFGLLERLKYASNEAARRLVDGEIDDARAAVWLENFSLKSPELAARQVRFIRKYRSYVINYNHGLDLVRAYMERRTHGDDGERWRVFAELISSPRLPSGLE